jgi:hypothetical protein
VIGLLRRLRSRRVRRLLAEAARDLDRVPLPEAVAARVAAGPSARPRRRALERLHILAGEVLREAGEASPCLVRALALLGEARRLGFPARLALGARREDEAVLAHAWLVVEGKPLLDDPATLEGYRVLGVLPPD